MATTYNRFHDELRIRFLNKDDVDAIKPISNKVDISSYLIRFLSRMMLHDAIIISIFCNISHRFLGEKRWNTLARNCEGRCIVRMVSFNIGFAYTFICLFFIIVSQSSAHIKLYSLACDVAVSMCLCVCE